MLRVGFRDANATRYLSAVGLVLLLWDHIITIGDEVQLIWSARPSFAKYAFLANRYVVAITLILISYRTLRCSSTQKRHLMLVPDMNHYISGIERPIRCRRAFSASSLIGITSVGTAHALVLLRVITLWDRNRTAMILMSTGFAVSFTATFTTMIVALTNLIPGVQFNSIVHMCVSTSRSKALIAVWSSPLAFEVLVLMSTCWNAFDRPRESHTPLTKALYSDGITFFIVGHLFSLRLLNLILAIVAPPSLTVLGVFFVWAMTTLVLNRSLLRIQKVEYVRRDGPILDGGSSPFGLLQVSDYDIELDEDGEYKTWHR
ncbi:hypothetical protein BD410DRAFT_722722 [Rickenella mellea]|uniref:DUF6533 domain-containing protein n=1 Tax=Rickenella mellea TaxID=50990 RepID=A0A4Y7Q4Z7_9AGAM|nr:hypothetical protein BD410DRAFT_722722 [Rickenella mellea]